MELGAIWVELGGTWVKLGGIDDKVKSMVICLRRWMKTTYETCTPCL